MRPRCIARTCWCAAAALFGTSAVVHGQSEEALGVDGFLSIRGAAVASADSWLAGGFGRLQEGSGAPDEFAAILAAELNAALAWQPSERFRAYLHAVARHEHEPAAGQAVGIAEAYAALSMPLGERSELALRAGMLFHPTSRENTAPLWGSRYTIAFSAINSWIADEIRPVGVEALLAHTSAGGTEIDLLAMPFRGADTAGALLAWRGWTLGSRLSVPGEELPLPPLPSLEPDGAFAAQRVGRTEPIDELDGRTGYLARARWQRPGVALVQAAHFDNRGDRGLHGDQYAWATHFVQLGVELALGSRAVLLGEWLRGSTAMGPDVGAHVDTDVEAWYALVSREVGRGRLSVRYDRFSAIDRDHTAEPDDERGWALTGAFFWRLVPRIRLGVELLHIAGDRPAAAWSGANPDMSADRASIELRIPF